MKIKKSDFKRIFYIVFGLIFVLISYYCFSTYKTMDNNSEDSSIYNVVNSITPENLKEYIIEREYSYIYFGRPNCSDCSDFEPELLKMINDYQIKNKIAYVNVINTKKNDKEWEYFKKTFQISYTPTLVKYKSKNSEFTILDKVEWTPEVGTVLNDFKSFLIKIK